METKNSEDNKTFVPKYDPQMFIQLRMEMLTFLVHVLDHVGKDLVMDLVVNVTSAVSVDLAISKEQLLGAVERAYRYYDENKDHPDTRLLGGVQCEPSHS